ncbi:MAG: hypothetical protein FWD53_07945, partial [Phycisphaerales bacterium]|nr:hypothetical protein [Phycisphaerales bacterium]
MMKVLMVCVLMVGLAGCAVVKGPVEQPMAASAVGTDLTVELVKFTGNVGPNVDQFTFRFTNISGKNIKAIKGKIRALDRFGVALDRPREADIQTDIKAAAAI